MNLILSVLHEAWNLLLESSVYIIFGLMTGTVSLCIQSRSNWDPYSLMIMRGAACSRVAAETGCK